MEAENIESIEDDERPLIEHIRELRKVFIRSLLFVLIGFVISYIYVEDIYSYLVLPLAEQFAEGEDRKMIFTGLTEAFFTYVKLSLFAGFLIAFPFIAWQIYDFIAPGLYKNEKKFFIGFFASSPVLFAIGGAFVYYVLFPTAWKFFLSFEIDASETGGIPIMLEARVSEYLSIVVSLILAFGITFQLPIVLLMLVKRGLLSVELLRAFRKYAIVVILLAAAILTPPDVISQIALALPLFLLYEMTIFLSKFIKQNA